MEHALMMSTTLITNKGTENHKYAYTSQVDYIFKGEFNSGFALICYLGHLGEVLVHSCLNNTDD